MKRSKAAPAKSSGRVERDDGGYDVDVRGADGRITEVDVSSAFKAVPDDDAIDAQGRELEDDEDD